MGIVHVVHQLDPAIVRHVVERLAGKERVTAAEAKALLEELGKNPADAELSSWQELKDLAEHDAALLLNMLLLSAASSRSWDLDKSLSRPAGGLMALFTREPSLRPVERLFMTDLHAADVPSAFDLGGEGLSGIATEKELRAAELALQPFAGADGRARAASAKGSLLSRLLGDKAYREAWMEDDYLWSAFERLQQAVQTTTSKGQWLGIVVG